MIKAKCIVTTKGEEGYKEFLSKIKELKGSYVTIGIHEDAGEYQKKGKANTAPSVVQVAFWNEFGTEDIPQRPFIRNVMYGKESEINALREKLLKEIPDNKITVKQGLDKIGFRIREMIRNQISGRSPFQANADSTIEHKKREGVTPPNKPLYETGLLMRSIEFRTVLK